ncbi:MAG TPA: energy transducer TonB [Terracidiphilus sp.]|nr:energy transducer TonB [Terracidiphilus sp.]
MMNLFTRIAFAALLPASLMIAQQTPPAATPSAQASGDEILTIQPSTTGLVSPVIQMAELRPAAHKRCKHADEKKVALFAAIDADGRPHFSPSDASGRMGWAAQLLQSEHYLPATLNQKPVAVALRIALEVSACRDKHAKKDSPVDPTRLSRQPKISLEPLGIPVTQVDLSADGAIESFSTDKVQNVVFVVKGRVDPPVFIDAPDVQFPDELRAVAPEGNCRFDVIVGKDGRVKQFGLSHASNPVFIPSAAQAVSGYLFKPAMRNGEPVPVQIQIVINFNPNQMN